MSSLLVCLIEGFSENEFQGSLGQEPQAPQGTGPALESLGAAPAVAQGTVPTVGPLLLCSSVLWGSKEAWTQDLPPELHPQPCMYIFIYYWYQGSNSGPSTCKASSGTAKLNPQPCIYLFLLGDRVLLSCSDWALTHGPLASASQSAGIIGIYHDAWLVFLFLSSAKTKHVDPHTKLWKSGAAALATSKFQMPQFPHPKDSVTRTSSVCSVILSIFILGQTYGEDVKQFCVSKVAPLYIRNYVKYPLWFCLFLELGT